MQRLIDAINQYILETQDDKRFKEDIELLLEVKKEAMALLHTEKYQITHSFDAGEFNMMNSKRDEGFEYESGQDYFNKLFFQN